MIFLKTVKKHVAALDGLDEVLLVIPKDHLDTIRDEVNQLNQSDPDKYSQFNESDQIVSISIDGVSLYYTSKEWLNEIIRFNELQKKVVQWGYDKEILTKGNPLKQADKTLEEAQEIKDAIQDGDIEEIKDGLGDTLVTLILQAKMQNVSLMDCLEQAYNVIAKREGEMVDGIFVKDK